MERKSIQERICIYRNTRILTEVYLSFEVVGDFCFILYIFLKGTKTLVKHLPLLNIYHVLYATDKLSHLVLIMTNQDHQSIFILRIRKVRPGDITGLAEGQLQSQNLFLREHDETAAILNHHTAYPKFVVNIYYCYHQKTIFKMKMDCKQQLISGLSI